MPVGDMVGKRKAGGMKYWALISGGKDSIATAHVLANRNELEGCVFIDTGIAAPDVQPFVRELCDRQGWELEIARASNGPLKSLTYDEIVLRYGFPGPAQHTMVMDYLKARAMRSFILTRHPDAAFASGVRRLESKRRSLNAKRTGTIRGAKVIAPIFDWPTDRVWAYLREKGMDVSPSYRTIHISGDCLCGAYAHPDEILLIRAFYPEVGERIECLEQAVAKVKPKCVTWRYLWGCMLGATGARQQTTLETMLCQNCGMGRG